MCGRWYTLAAVLLCFGLAPRAAANEPGPRPQDEQAIRQTAQEYLAALARGDGKAQLEFWTADGDIVDETGRSYPARELIASAPAGGEDEARPQLKLTGSSIRFLTADVAIENGTSEVVHPAAGGAPPLAGRFSVIWVKQNGKWRLAHLREMRAEPPATAAQLAQLDWMAGDWSGASGETTIEIAARWNATHTYLLRDLKILNEGNAVFSGAQRIGWDPLTKKIKSWVFDTNGGHGEGVWTKSGNSWVVQASGVLADGQQTTSTNVYTPDGKDHFTWKSNGAQIGDQPGPELNIELTRRPAAK